MRTVQRIALFNTLLVVLYIYYLQTQPDRINDDYRPPLLESLKSTKLFNGTRCLERMPPLNATVAVPKQYEVDLTCPFKCTYVQVTPNYDTDSYNSIVTEYAEPVDLGLGTNLFSSHFSSCQVCKMTLIRNQALDKMMKFMKKSEIIEKSANLGGWTGLVDQVYIVHYSRAQLRKAEMTKLFNQLRIDPVFVTQFDREELTPTDQMDIFFIQTSLLDNRPTFVKRRFSIGEASLTLKHFLIYYQVLKNNYERVAVFEDDTMLETTYSLENFKRAMNQLPADFDIAHVGGCNHTPRASEYNQHLQIIRSKHRCSQGYIISRKGAYRMFNSLPMRWPIDDQMWKAGMDIQQYHVNPPLFRPSAEINRKQSTRIRGWFIL